MRCLMVIGDKLTKKRQVRASGRPLAWPCLCGLTVLCFGEQEEMQEGSDPIPEPEQ